MRKIVVNTTPIIALSHLGKLSLLGAIYGEVTIPSAVREEVFAKEDSICVSEFFKNEKYIKVRDIENTLAKSLFKSQLHSGEVEVMILAKELSADLVIIDDANAKKYAEYLGLTVTGTLGVLLRAKELGLIEKLKPYVDNMRNDDIFLSDRVVNYCLKLAGEVE